MGFSGVMSAADGPVESESQDAPDPKRRKVTTRTLKRMKGRGETITVVTDSELWADGEPFGGQTFSAARGALRVATNLTPP